MASRKLSDLHPDLEPLCIKFISECQHHGVDILVTCTYRSNEEQQILYDQGRSSPGKIVTNAKPGFSAHNYVNASGNPSSMAFDVVPITDGKPNWDKDDPVWKIIGAIGREVGLQWAGDWVNFREYPHFQLPGFKP